MVTVGCQEAMVLALRALRAGPTDVLLAVSPTYVGLTGAARLVDMPRAAGVRRRRRHRPRRPARHDPARARESGLRPRALLRDAGLREPVRASAWTWPPGGAAGARRGARTSCCWRTIRTGCSTTRRPASSDADPQGARRAAPGGVPGLVREDRAARRAGRLRGGRPAGARRGRHGRAARRRAVEDQEHADGEHPGARAGDRRRQAAGARLQPGAGDRARAGGLRAQQVPHDRRPRRRGSGRACR